MLLINEELCSRTRTRTLLTFRSCWMWPCVRTLPYRTHLGNSWIFSIFGKVSPPYIVCQMPYAVYCMSNWRSIAHDGYDAYEAHVDDDIFVGLCRFIFFSEFSPIFPIFLYFFRNFFQKFVDCVLRMYVRDWWPYIY